MKAYVLIQTQVDKTASVAAWVRTVPGVSETASVAGPYDVIARVQARDMDELAKLVASIEALRRDTDDKLHYRSAVRFGVTTRSA